MATHDTYEGSWWASTVPDLRLRGTLRHTGRSGYEVEMLGSPDDIHAIGQFTIQGVPLFGRDDRGTPITVWYLPLSTFPGSASITLPVKRAMVGIHSSEDPKFVAARFTFRNLSGWSGRTSGLGASIDPSGVITGVSHERAPDDIAAMDGATVRLGESITFESSLQGTAVRTQTQLAVETAEPVTFGDMLGRYLRPIQHLMTFAFDQGMAIDALALKSPTQDLPVTPIFEPVLDPTEDDPESPWRPLFQLNEAPGGFEQLVPRWFLLYERTSPLLDLLLLQKYISHVPFAEQRLLMNAQAAEGLHRRFDHRFEQYSLDPDEHTVLMTDLEAGVSNDNSRQWAIHRLQRNEPSFRRRLIDLVEYAGSATREILRPNPRQWASTVRDVRNRWTHWSTDSPSDIDGGRVRALADGLGVVLASCILAELGFDEGPRNTVIRRSDGFRWTALVEGIMPPP